MTMIYVAGGILLLCLGMLLLAIATKEFANVILGCVAATKQMKNPMPMTNIAQKFPTPKKSS